MIFRDDDISCFTDLTTLKTIQGLFDIRNKVHTCSLLMKDLWESKGIWFWLMTTKNIDVALHGWEHIDYSLLSKGEIESDIRKCLTYWEINSKRAMDVYGYDYRPIKVFYPPWNKSSNDLIEVCDTLGLEVCTKTKVSHPDEVWDFHWFECVRQDGLDKLKEALRQ